MDSDACTLPVVNLYATIHLHQYKPIVLHDLKNLNDENEN